MLDGIPVVSQIERPSAQADHAAADGRRPDRQRTRADLSNQALTLAAACVAPVLYVLFVNHYSVNSFNGDDWSTVLVVHPFLHGQLSPSTLWRQYNESRLVMGNAVDVLFGRLDGLDLRSVILFSAALFVAAYAILLAMFRRYLDRPLTPLPVLVVGAVWFSVADVQNSLWAFQVSWYLTVLFFVVVLFALLVPTGHRSFWLTVAVLAAAGASLSTVQGFLTWPLGLICLCWGRSWARRVPIESATWVASAALMICLYLWGYDFGNNGCIPSTSCNPSATVHHLGSATGFFFGLLGNVVPGGVPPLYSPRSTARFVLLGVALFAAAVFIVIRSWRQRATVETLPLPLLLIGFSLAFDLTIALGRGGSGAKGAIDSNRYVMANLILLTGIVIYACKHLPPLLRSPDGRSRKRWVAGLAGAVLSGLVVVQIWQATSFGLNNARVNRSLRATSAQLFVNLDRVPPGIRPCAILGALYLQPGSQPSFFRKLGDANADRLGQFEPAASHHYRQLGPPALPSSCSPRPIIH